MGQETLHVKLLKHTLDPEEVIAMAARLCYANANIDELEEKVQAKDQTKFILGLLEVGHLSTIEHASFTFGVEGVSRSLLAQITRHRLASFSVQSQRYVGAYTEEEGKTFGYVVPKSIEALGQDAVREYENQMKTIQRWYNGWIEKFGGSREGANEDARFVLPNGATTKFIVTMNIRELLHFFSLRCCNRAQWEIRELATEMLRLCKEVAPVLFQGAGPACVTGPCAEGKRSCGKAAEMRKKFLEL